MPWIYLSMVNVVKETRYKENDEVLGYKIASHE